MPLTIKPPRRPSTSDTLSGNNSSFDTTRDTSPVRPLASPISPKVQPSKAKALPNVDLIDNPPSRPFSDEDSTDAIALRAAISSLQVQRKKAEEDIKTLQKIRNDALARPDEFQKHVVETATKQLRKPSKFNVNAPDEQDEKMVDSPQAFPPIPEPQDVVRCPPINWDKYHVVGESFDRMHNAQKAGQRGVASQYDPAVDRLETRKNSTPREGRKDSGASAGSLRNELRPFTKVTASR
ncbi:hypothetical protein KVT40_001015 [Elsinoe batatas]|uniref:Uncharacterized protein n=1 Tax=Elsinoe batatas TaxID=2601811 RepID=A0A8K0PGY6_9PEZI|nr:hypothetical protein KVT40_001015 [Elsinoe batatas]